MRHYVLLLMTSLVLPAWAAYETNFSGFYLLETNQLYNWRLESNGNQGATLAITNSSGLIQVTLTGSTGPTGSATPYVDLYLDIPVRGDNSDSNIVFSWEFDSPNFTSHATTGEKAWFMADWLPATGTGSEAAPAGYRYIWGDDKLGPASGAMSRSLPDTQSHRIGWRLFSDNTGAPDVLRIVTIKVPDPGSPTLRIAPSEGGAGLQWSDATCHLQATGNLSNAPASAVWTNYPGTSPVGLPASSDRLFLRLTR